MILYFEYNVNLKTYSNFKVKDELPYGNKVVYTEWSDILGLDDTLLVWVNNDVWIPIKKLNHVSKEFDEIGFKVISKGVILTERFLKLNRINKIL